jgi:hypothetical protein
MCVYNESFRCLELERSTRDKEGSTPASLSCKLSTGGRKRKAVKVSFGRVECREFARTVGDNEVVGPIPLSLDWEVLSCMVASVDQYEALRAPKRRTDFLLATPEERVAVLEKCGVVESQMYRLERERLNRLEKDWSPLLEEMARTYPTKHEGPQGVRQSLKKCGRTWSAIRRRISLKSAKKNMKSLMKKLRVTFKRTRNPKAAYGARLQVSHVPRAKANATASRGLEALVLAQSDLPTTAALNLTIKWEKVLVEGKGDDAFVCCTCLLECCVVSRVVLRL